MSDPRRTTAEVEALLAEATPGPWRADRNEPVQMVVSHEHIEPGGRRRKMQVDVGTYGGVANEIADAALLAAAPDLAQDLIDARAQVTRLEHAVHVLLDMYDDTEASDGIEADAAWAELRRVLDMLGVQPVTKFHIGAEVGFADDHNYRGVVVDNHPINGLLVWWCSEMAACWHRASELWLRKKTMRF